jgi:hypothetical protein
MIYTPQFGSQRDLLYRRGFEKLLRTRLIFTVAPGRCGTETLFHAFGLAKDAVSVHEPPPRYSDCLRQVQRNAERAMTFLLEEKFPAVLGGDRPCYVETSHLVCKGFIEPILELGLRPHFLILQREPRAVAKSFLLIDSVPERTWLGKNYMLSPADPCLLETPCWEDFTDYQLCYWYAIEMHQRSQWYAALFDRLGINYTRFNFVEIGEPHAVETLMGAAGVPLKRKARRQLADLLARPRNAKADVKREVGRQAEVADEQRLEEQETAVLRACRWNFSDNYPSRLNGSFRPDPAPAPGPSRRRKIVQTLARGFPPQIREALKGSAAVSALYQWFRG